MAQYVPLGPELLSYRGTCYSRERRPQRKRGKNSHVERRSVSTSRLWARWTVASVWNSFLQSWDKPALLIFFFLSYHISVFCHILFVAKGFWNESLDSSLLFVLLALPWQSWAQIWHQWGKMKKYIGSVEENKTKIISYCVAICWVDWSPTICAWAHNLMKIIPDFRVNCNLSSPLCYESPTTEDHQRYWLWK